MNQYPSNDDQFEDTAVIAVDPQEDGGWIIKRADNWSFFIQESTIVPEVGMHARFYGKGLGYLVRGLFLNGQEVFYRTRDEADEKQKAELYGENIEDWLRRWDAGKTVWSIEMGGMGPGYEQAIQITAAEMVRNLIKHKFNSTMGQDRDEREVILKRIGNELLDNPMIQSLGLSGAQWSGALNLAIQLYVHGPQAVMSDDAVTDRQIQVSRNFPGVENHG